MNSDPVLEGVICGADILAPGAMLLRELQLLWCPHASYRRCSCRPLAARRQMRDYARQMPEPRTSSEGQLLVVLSVQVRGRASFHKDVAPPVGQVELQCRSAVATLEAEQRLPGPASTPHGERRVDVISGMDVILGRALNGPDAVHGLMSHDADPPVEKACCMESSVAALPSPHSRRATRD